MALPRTRSVNEIIYNAMAGMVAEGTMVCPGPGPGHYRPAEVLPARPGPQASTPPAPVLRTGALTTRRELRMRQQAYFTRAMLRSGSLHSAATDEYAPASD